jgi:hypothetical protein
MLCGGDAYRIGDRDIGADDLRHIAGDREFCQQSKRAASGG